MSIEYVLIPRERVAVLIGPEGTTRKKIEKLCEVTMTIEADGRVTIESTVAPLKMMNAVSITKAVGRGFSPKHALELLNEDSVLEIIDLEDVIRSERAIQRQKARIIGRNGKSRELMEQMLNIYISVYGNTVSIIGTPEKIALAKAAIEKLLNGAMHSTVFKFISAKVRELDKEVYEKI